MNPYVTGQTIQMLREKRRMTQKQLADLLYISDKTVSKWETGKGLPDIMLLEPLAKALHVSVPELFSGTEIVNQNRTGNMLKTRFYVCPVCGNVISAAGEGAFHCCGILLPPLEPEEPDTAHDIIVTPMDGEYYVRMAHPMTKRHFISFFAAVTAERVTLVKLYPEQEPETRLPQRAGAGCMRTATSTDCFACRFAGNSAEWAYKTKKALPQRNAAGVLLLYAGQSVGNSVLFFGFVGIAVFVSLRHMELCRLVCGIVIRTEGADTICTAAGCSGSVLCGFLAVLRSLFCVGSFFRCVAETDIVIFVLVCAAASAFRQVVTVAGLVQSLVVCFFQCKYSCSRGCSCGCDHCSNDGSFHVDTSFLRHLVSVVIWKFCGSAAENTDVVYILIIPCFQRKYKPRHPEFWRLCGKNFQSGEDQTCSSACFRSAVISPMFSRPTEMRIRPPSMPAAFSCSSVSWR